MTAKRSAKICRPAWASLFDKMIAPAPMIRNQGDIIDLWNWLNDNKIAGVQAYALIYENNHIYHIADGGRRVYWDADFIWANRKEINDYARTMKAEYELWLND